MGGAAGKSQIKCGHAPIRKPARAFPAARQALQTIQTGTAAEKLPRKPCDHWSDQTHACAVNYDCIARPTARGSSNYDIGSWDLPAGRAAPRKRID